MCFQIFQSVNFFTKVGTGKAVTPFIEIENYIVLLTVIATREIFVLIFRTYNPYINTIKLKDILQILLGRIRNNFIHIFAAFQLNITLHHSLCWFVFLRSVYCRVSLQTNDKVVTLCTRFCQHSYMSGMKQVETAEGNTGNF